MCICILLVGVLGKYVNSLCMWWLLFSLFTSKMLVFVCVKYSDHARFIASRTSYMYLVGPAIIIATSPFASSTTTHTYMYLYSGTQALSLSLSLGQHMAIICH